MSIPLFEINEVLYKWAANEPLIDEFTVENVLNAVGLYSTSYDEVFHYLMSKRDYELIPKKMVLCPKNHKGETFLLDESIEGDLFDCFCGESEFEANNFLIVFSFTDAFRQGAIKKKSNVFQTEQLRNLALV